MSEVDSVRGQISVGLKEHQIGWVLPPGAKITSAVLELPCGAMIQGEFNGKIICKAGSLIISAGAVFSGSADAQDIYIEGSVRNPGQGIPSTLRASSLIAVSDRATGGAHLIARAFSIHTKSFAASFKTIRDEDREEAGLPAKELSS